MKRLFFFFAFVSLVLMAVKAKAQYLSQREEVSFSELLWCIDKKVGMCLDSILFEKGYVDHSGTWEAQSLDGTRSYYGARSLGLMVNDTAFIEVLEVWTSDDTVALVQIMTQNYFRYKELLLSSKIYGFKEVRRKRNENLESIKFKSNGFNMTIIIDREEEIPGYLIMIFRELTKEPPLRD